MEIQNKPEIRKLIEAFLNEDDLSRNFTYQHQLPKQEVTCVLNFKSEMMICGMPFFSEVFNTLNAETELNFLQEWEGKNVSQGQPLQIKFEAPFNVALNAERVALNLLQRASAVATLTQKFSSKANLKNIKILDTRKTTPGLRWLEKYAVVVGGGYNHRFGQNDVWMIKDNHKTFFGGLKSSVEFFEKQKSFYTPTVAEIHNKQEFLEAKELGIKHLMLDNFSPDEIKELVKLKSPEMTFEVSGGVRLENIENYLLSGVDAISIGALTNNPPPVDISMKMEKK